MIRKTFPIFLILCLSCLGLANPGIAQEKVDRDVIAQLQSEGWTIFNDGVLRRERRPNEVETFVFGVQGFNWKLQDLRAQYVKLQAAYQATPTPELKRTIANHRKEMASTMRMIQRARQAEKLGLVDDLKVSCTINFAYNATAGPRTDVQGTWGDGTASFSATCPGFSGEVYAYSTATVWVNGGPYTQAVTDGPRSGSNVSARAYAQAAGGSPCDSYSYGSMTSNNLNPSSYSMAATNSTCTGPPPNITISSGPYSIDLRVSFCKTVTWGSTVTGGTPAFTYSWSVDGYQVGTGSSQSLTVCRGDYYYSGGFTLDARVTDSLSRWDNDSRWISVLEPSQTCEDPCLCPLATVEQAVPILPCY
ncbi:MAG TPA: hypothetical protein VF789_07320 [Thermoanaerobaculia bacterium]